MLGKDSRGRAQSTQTVPYTPLVQVPAEEFHRVLTSLAFAGLDIAGLCRKAMAGPEVPDRAADHVSVDLVRRVFAAAAELSGDQHIGLRAAHQASLSQVVAHLAAASPTLRDGLEQLGRYQSGLFGAGTIHLQLDRRIPEIIIAPGLPAGAHRHVVEYWMASLCGELVSIAGPTVIPRAVHFAHTRIGAAARYTRVFGCPVRFGGATSRLRLWRESLGQPSRCANRNVAADLQRLLNMRLEVPRRAPLRDRVAEALRASMTARGGGNRATIARQLRMSVRTLQRRLEHEGATFRQLRDLVRKERTIQMAEQGSVTVAALASAVGFTETATLRRAFKRWTGVTPREYRSATARSGRLPATGARSVAARRRGRV